MRGDEDSDRRPERGRRRPADGRSGDPQDAGFVDWDWDASTRVPKATRPGKRKPPRRPPAAPDAPAPPRAAGLFDFEADLPAAADGPRERRRRQSARSDTAAFDAAIVEDSWAGDPLAGGPVARDLNPRRTRRSERQIDDWTVDPTPEPQPRQRRSRSSASEERMARSARIAERAKQVREARAKGVAPPPVEPRDRATRPQRNADQEVYEAESAVFEPPPAPYDDGPREGPDAELAPTSGQLEPATFIPEIPIAPVGAPSEIGDPVTAGRPRATRPRLPQPDEERGGPTTAASRTKRLATNTLIFSIATGLSRIAGLVREVAAAGLYGVGGPISAFTIAFQIPNLVRALVADSALSAAFVPVFTELLEQGKRREAYSLAGSLFGFIAAALTVVTLLFILLAGFIIPPFTGGGFDHSIDDLTVGLSRVLFPILILLGINGLTVGILNAYDHFSIPAIAPLVWNVVIIVFMVLLRPFFHGDDKIYAYAIGVLIGTAVQLGMSLPVLRQVGFPLKLSLKPDPRMKQVFRLMLPVTVGLGIINFDLLINSTLGTLVSQGAPREIDAAFRIYMLPQGMFSVAVATVLFPALSRFAANKDIDGLRATMGVGLRQIFLLLVPAAAATIALSIPITRLVYQRGAFDGHDTKLVASALFWFSFSLPWAGANLLLTRTFFALQRPWFPTALAGGSLVVNGAASLALYKPIGIGGVVIGTAIGSIAMMIGQVIVLSKQLNGLEERRTLTALFVTCLASALLGLVSYLVWRCVDHVLGEGLIAQLISVGLGLTAGTVAYTYAVLWLNLPEAHQVARLIGQRIPARFRPPGLVK